MKFLLHEASTLTRDKLILQSRTDGKYESYKLVNLVHIAQYYSSIGHLKPRAGYSFYIYNIEYILYNIIYIIY